MVFRKTGSTSKFFAVLVAPTHILAYISGLFTVKLYMARMGGFSFGGDDLLGSTSSLLLSTADAIF